MTKWLNPVTVALVLLLAISLGYLTRRIVDALDTVAAGQRDVIDRLDTLAERQQHEHAVERAVDRAAADAAAAADRLTYRINQPTNQPRRDGMGAR